MKNLFFIFCLLILASCGDPGDDKVSRGHRDAIKNECKDASDIKACGLELRRKFLEDGNKFADLDCFASKHFSLETYNDCLERLKIAALEGNLWKDHTGPDGPGPIDPIDELEMLTVRIDIVEKRKDGKVYFIGGGSGVMIDSKKKLIATNCHVAMISLKKPDRKIVVKKINKQNYAVAKIYKKAEEHDVCIIEKINDSEFKFEIKSVKRFKKFEKLKKGEFVRSFGTPELLEGHTASGQIQYLGKAGESQSTQYGDYVIDEDTKIIEHSATIASGSSGGPLFDNKGYLVGLNTFGDEKWNFSISSDHIEDLLNK